MGLIYGSKKYALISHLIKKYPMIYVGCRTRNDFIKRHGLVDGKLYGKIDGSKIELYYYSIIDANYISQAEMLISKRFDLTESKILFKGHKELVVINETDLKDIKKEYKIISEMYCDKMAVINGMIKEEQHKNEMLQMEIERLRDQLIYKRQIHERDIALLNKDNEMLRSQLEQ